MSAIGDAMRAHIASAMQIWFDSDKPLDSKHRKDMLQKMCAMANVYSVETL